MSPRFGSAVIIGGSIAGMLAARALSRHFAKVTLLERDILGGSAEMRRGVPQASHIHAVLTKGRYLLDEFFPGIVEEVVDAGAIMIDHINDRRRLAPYGWQPRFPTELRMLLISRPLLEFHIRKRVNEIPNVEFVGSMLALGLNASEGKISGVVAAPVKDRDNAQRIDADLVIDASGRSSRTPDWLDALGFGKVEEMRLFQPLLRTACRLALRLAAHQHVAADSPNRCATDPRRRALSAGRRSLHRNAGRKRRRFSAARR
jgi:2-polyprenyl-6-methoxyphenol hydroxylase-like FAD-dependent oxidoreductase